jgi:hypothetical protein
MWNGLRREMGLGFTAVVEKDSAGSMMQFPLYGIEHCRGEGFSC